MSRQSQIAFSNLNREERKWSIVHPDGKSCGFKTNDEGIKKQSLCAACAQLQAATRVAARTVKSIF